MSSSSPIKRLPRLGALKTFTAVVRCGGFQEAAAELHVTPSAVSHQITNLEQELGVTLFRRDGRRHVPTASARAYADRLEEAFQMITEATRSFGSAESGHTLHVHSAPSFASLWLMPNLEAFTSRFPDQRISVYAAPLVQPFESPTHNLAITYGEPTGSGLIVAPLASEVVQPLCSPELISKGLPLTTPEDLRNHVLIHSRTRTSWGAWLSARKIREDSIRRHLRVDLSAMAIDSAVRGLGVILESDLLAAEELRQGRLIAPFAEPAAPEPAYFLAYRSEDAGASHIMTFAHWLLGEFGQPTDLPSAHETQ